MTIPQTQGKLEKLLNARRALSSLSLSEAMQDAYIEICNEIERTHSELNGMMQCEIVLIETGNLFCKTRDLHAIYPEHLKSIRQVIVGNTRIAVLDLDSL